MSNLSSGWGKKKISAPLGVLVTKIVRNYAMTTKTTPSLVAMALSAARNNNQQMKGANERGDGVEGMETATAMVTATAMATARANSDGKGFCDGDGDGDSDGNCDSDGKGDGDVNTTINKQRGSDGGGGGGGGGGGSGSGGGGGGGGGCSNHHLCVDLYGQSHT